MLHNNVPVTLVAVNNELPQLFTTVTPGADGIDSGTDDALAVELHPFATSVRVTSYVAEFVTVIDEDVDPLLHNNVVPETVLVDNTELPQLLVTVIVGVAGTRFGADEALAVAVQPFAASVRVTLYVAVFVTVIDEDVDPLLHNNVVPEMALVDNTELPQLLVTVTPGVAGIDLGADDALAAAVHPLAASVRVTSYVD